MFSKFLMLIFCAPAFFAAAAPLLSISLPSAQLSSVYAAGHAPSDWKAQAQMNRFVSEIWRKDKQEITIIYSGNTKGEVIPYPPSQDALGGLSKSASVINSIRKDYPVNFSIDVGNMLDSSSNPLRVRLAADYYNHMNFDAIAPGAGELTLGIPGFLARLPIVISNMRNMPKFGIVDGVPVEQDGYKLYIINLIGRSLINDEDVLANITTNVGRVKSLLDREEAKKAHLRIAVVHADLEEIKRLAEMTEGIDVIIAGGIDERFHSPLKIGSTLILSAGNRGRFVGSLSVRFDDNKKRISITNRLHPVYQDITPDAAVENMVRLVGATVLIDETKKRPVISKKAELIPFLSDRGATPQVFIKNTRGLSEYLISENLSDCRRPVISADESQAAFIFGSPQNGSLRIVDLKTLNGRTVPVNQNVTDLFFSRDNFLYFIASDSANPKKGAVYKTKLFMDDAVTVLEFSNTISNYSDLSLSPDGSTLLFCAEINNRRQVFAVDSSMAASPSALTTAKADTRTPRFSPDGRFIAYLSDRGSFGGKMDLWIMEARSPFSHRQITFHANVSDYCWGEDSKEIYFSAGVNITDINSIGIRENTVRKLITADSVKTWSETAPLFFEYNKRPKLIYTRIGSDGTQRLRMFDLRSGRDEQLFRFEDGNEWRE